MLKKIQRGMEKWGHYLLALLCAADQGQRLEDAMQTPEPAAYARPAEGAVIRDYSESPLFFSETGVWMIHPGLDFEAAAGETVGALAAGTVLSCEDGIRIDHGDGLESLYRGVQDCKVLPGQKVRAGDALGTAGAAVPFEGKGHVCVMLFQDGKPVAFGDTWE